MSWHFYLVQDKPHIFRWTSTTLSTSGGARVNPANIHPPTFFIVVWVSLCLFDTILHVWTLKPFCVILTSFSSNNISSSVPRLLLQDYSFIFTFPVIPGESSPLLFPKQCWDQLVIWSCDNLYIDSSLNESYGFQLAFNISH